MTGESRDADEAAVTPVLMQVPCEVYSRVVGYLRPVGNWHESKQQEFRDRTEYVLPGDDETDVLVARRESEAAIAAVKGDE